MICFYAFHHTDFKWTFNNSAESIDVAASHVSRHGKWTRECSVCIVCSCVNELKNLNLYSHIKHITAVATDASLEARCDQFFKAHQINENFHSSPSPWFYVDSIKSSSNSKSSSRTISRKCAGIKWEWKIPKTLQLRAKWKILTQFVSAHHASAPLCTPVPYKCDEVYAH